jgi:hypothetical protein
MGLHVVSHVKFMNKITKNSYISQIQLKREKRIIKNQSKSLTIKRSTLYLTLLKWVIKRLKRQSVVRTLQTSCWGLSKANPTSTILNLSQIFAVCKSYNFNSCWVTMNCSICKTPPSVLMAIQLPIMHQICRMKLWCLLKIGWWCRGRR